jgi:hypothetical protein
MIMAFIPPLHRCLLRRVNSFWYKHVSGNPKIWNSTAVPSFAKEELPFGLLEEEDLYEVGTQSWVIMTVEDELWREMLPPLEETNPAVRFLKGWKSDNMELSAFHIAFSSYALHWLVRRQGAFMTKRYDCPTHAAQKAKNVNYRYWHDFAGHPSISYLYGIIDQSTQQNIGRSTEYHFKQFSWNEPAWNEKDFLVTEANAICRMFVRHDYVLLVTSDSFDHDFALSFFSHEDFKRQSRSLKWSTVFPYTYRFKWLCAALAFDGTYLMSGDNETIEAFDVFDGSTKSYVWVHDVPGATLTQDFLGLSRLHYTTGDDTDWCVGVKRNKSLFC